MTLDSYFTSHSGLRVGEIFWRIDSRCLLTYLLVFGRRGPSLPDVPFNTVPQSPAKRSTLLGCCVEEAPVQAAQIALYNLNLHSVC